MPVECGTGTFFGRPSGRVGVSRQIEALFVLKNCPTVIARMGWIGGDLDPVRLIVSHSPAAKVGLVCFRTNANKCGFAWDDYRLYGVGSSDKASKQLGLILLQRHVLNLTHAYLF